MPSRQFTSATATFGSSTSKPLTQTVDYRTTTALTSVTPNPSTLGQSVTFTAHVNVKPPGTGFPTGGTVTFYDGWNSIGSAVKVSTIDGSAGLSYSGLSTGSHNISAVYSGYGNYESSKSSIITQTVIGPLLIKTSSLPNGAINKYYNQSLSASGGVPKYSWSIISGALPNGLTLNTSTGVITGKPTAVGTFNFTVQVIDRQGNFATKILYIKISKNY